MINELIDYLSKNQIFSGIAVGSLTTTVFISIAYYLRNLPEKFIKFILKKLIYKLEILSTDVEYYGHILVWLSQFNNRNLKSYTFKQYYDINDETSNILNMGSGIHIVWYKNRIIFIERSILEINLTANTPVVEKIIISYFGLSNKFLKNLVSEIEILDDKKDKVPIFINSQSFWHKKYKNNRLIKTIIFNRKYEILNIINNFLNNEKWYSEHGVPYKLGMLIYGPPGTGKSSFILSLASELKLGIYLLDLSNKNIINNINVLTSDIKKKSIILLEDFDKVFIVNEKFEENIIPQVLNLLDGLNSNHGCIYILTANDIDKINNILIRRGRIDLYIQMNNFGYDECKEMFYLFYPEATNEQFDYIYFKLKQNLKNDLIQPAYLQTIFGYNHDINDLINCINNNNY